MNDWGGIWMLLPLWLALSFFVAPLLGRWLRAARETHSIREAVECHAKQMHALSPERATR